MMVQDSRIFEEIFKNSVDCIVVIDEDGKVVLWNSSCEALTGYTIDEALGREIHRLLCSNEDYDRAQSSLKRVKNSRQSNLSGKTFSVTGYSKSGRKIRYGLSIFQINLDGKTYFVGTLRKTDYLLPLPSDSTISLDELLDVIPIPIFIKDNNLRYIHVNRAFEESTGIKRIDAKGKTVFELYPYELAKVYNEQDLKIISKPEKQVYSYKVLSKDGSLREVEFHKVSFTNRDGKVAGIIGAYIDIQERNELMRKLRAEKEKAEDALQTKSRFLSFMTHELRTPLSNIIGYVNLLITGGGLTKSQEESLRNIKNLAESLMSILTDILELSKLENYTLKLNLDEVNLPELIFDVVDNLKFECYLKGLEFYLHISPILPEKVRADRLRLKQVLINLISNAIKYTEKGFVELSIICDKTNMPPNTTKVSFRVSDSGIGISEDEIERIFEPFYRVEESTSRLKFGAGLGLYFTKKLVELMGSEIRVISRPGRGSTFSFELIFEIVEDLSEQDFEKFKGRRALLVIDLDRRFVSLMNYLLYWGVEVVIPSSEREFLNVLEENQNFDVLIVDVDSKSINIDRLSESIVLCKSIGKINKVVVLIKPTENIEQAHSKFSSFADLYLQKPINPRRLTYVFLEQKHDIEETKDSTDLKISLTPIKVLVVDDNEINRKIIKYLIQRLLPNADILEADNGESALIMQRSSKPDVVFMDIQMPRMDGFEAAKIIRQTDSKVAIVGISAYTGDEEKKKAFQSGFNYYFTKPIKVEDLKRVFSEVTSTVTQQKVERPSKIDHYYFAENQLDSNFVTNLLRLSLDTIPFYVEEIKNYYINRDFENLKKAAHKLKGSSYSAGLTGLAKIAELINKSERFDQEILQSKIDFLVREWEETEREIREFLRLQSQQDA